jgi:hypothetical protein
MNVMKKILFIFVAALTFVACEEHETAIDVERHTTMLLWGTEIPNWTSSQSQIYSSYSTTVRWPNAETDYIDVEIPVIAVGFAKDYDREFRIVQSNLNLSNTLVWGAYIGWPGQSYESVEGKTFVLPAGKLETTVPIRLLCDIPRFAGIYTSTYAIQFRFFFNTDEELIGDAGKATINVGRDSDFPAPAQPAVIQDWYDNNR